MEKTFISGLKIDHVRHLKNITISLSNEKIKHLIFTGKNGSGKTSVLEALSRYLQEERISRLVALCDGLSRYEKMLLELKKEETAIASTEENSRNVLQKEISAEKGGIDVTFNQSLDTVSTSLATGEFILAYYKAERIFQAEVPKHIENVELKDKYAITEAPGREFIRYLLDLKATEAFARNNGKCEKADEINQWFVKFQDLLRKIFSDDSLELIFEEDTFSFHIKEKGKELFDFNTLSGGYAAVLDIVLDMIIRMEKKTNRSFDFNVPGIVLVDEIETHLHIELQKTILELLTTIFPNIQFVVTTHSPFVLNSLGNVVIYDLENHLLVENGMNNLPYEGIVEGYFRADRMSHTLKANFERYKNLVQKEKLSDDEISEIAKLELYLDEIPDYLAIGITTEYQRLKLEYMNREDIDG